MNALVKKEIRLLLPNWVVAMLLALSFWIILEILQHSVIASSWSLFISLIWTVMLVMTTLSSFGGEFSSGTFSLLLAQPVSRARIWRTKTLVLTAAVLTIWLAWCGFQILHAIKTGGKWPSWRATLLPTGLFFLAAYSGGLWTMLLFRQMAVAFWFTVLTPMALWMTIANLLIGQPGKIVTNVFIIVSVVYAVAGFLLARWLFFRAQDAQWTGGAITMPEVRGLKWWGKRPHEPQVTSVIGSSAASSPRTWCPKAALFWKELQLHQSQFIIAGLLALLHLGAIATRKFGHFPQNSTPRFILESFWALWLVMPLLTGCAAVAEERKMGTLESLLCLPAKRRTPFAVKAGVVLLLSLVFGVAMPLLLEGTKILPNEQLWSNPITALVDYHAAYGSQFPVSTAQIFLWNCVGQIYGDLPLLMLMGIAVVIGVISFYASTLTRNTLQALGPAVIGILLTWFLLVVACQPEEFIRYSLWRGPLIYFIAVPVMTIVLAALAYWNYQRMFVGWNVWRRNLLAVIISLALVTVTTAALYHRAWELLTPLETPHGATRLVNSTKMRVNDGNIVVFLPDGRVWLNRYRYDQSNPFLEAAGKISQDPVFGGGRFLEGTNWTDVADCWLDIVGIQRDGSLWISEQPERRLVHWGLGEKPEPASTNLVRYGNDHDWKNVAASALAPFLLKTDGTLWRWRIWGMGGTNRVHRLRNWSRLHNSEPQRLGADSDWSEIFSTDDRAFFRKTNGQMWVYPPFSDDDTKLTLDHNVIISRIPYLDRKDWTSLASLGASDSALGFRGSVGKDGTFRVSAMSQLLQITNHPNEFRWGLVAQDAQIGLETNWLAVAGQGEKAVTLKRDGTLWLWNARFDQTAIWRPEYLESYKREVQNAIPVRLGAHSDWIAVGEMRGGVVSLAADGSLWRWRFEPQYSYRGQAAAWLAVSRRPEFLGNVFGKAD